MTGSATSSVLADSLDAAEVAQLFARVTRRLIPFMFVLYIVAYLDRINLGFAARQMKASLAFDDGMIGLAGSVFFVGYFIFQVPANLVLQRLGARRWISAIMISWGLVSAAQIFVHSKEVFYALRFLLGVAESGFFPGMILYLTWWFPQEQRARAVASFMTAIPCAGVLGGLISGPLLSLQGAGLQGWQWLYLCEAAPAILLGAMVLFYLDDGPSQAAWLSARERSWLTSAMADEQARRSSGTTTRVTAVMLDVRVWLLGLLYFSLMLVMYGISLWLPQIIGNFEGLSEYTVGWLSAIPYGTAAVVMTLVGRHSDRTGERRWHVTLSALACAIGLVWSAYATSPLTAVLAMSVAACGLWGAFGPFWSLPTLFLSGSAAAAGIAVVNSVGNLGGTLGSYGVGVLKTHSASFGAGLLFMALAAALAALLAQAVPRPAPNPGVEVR